MGSWYGLQVILTGAPRSPISRRSSSATATARRRSSTPDAIASRVVQRPIVPDEFLALVAERLAVDSAPSAMASQTGDVTVPVSISGQPGQLLDVSYGGCRVRVARRPVLSPAVRMSLEAPRIDLDAALIWSAISAGRLIVHRRPVVNRILNRRAWRQFVDHVH